jgi:hypothetical protein
MVAQGHMMNTSAGSVCKARDPYCHHLSTNHFFKRHPLITGFSGKILHSGILNAPTDMQFMQTCMFLNAMLISILVLSKDID